MYRPFTTSVLNLNSPRRGKPFGFTQSLSETLPPTFRDYFGRPDSVTSFHDKVGVTEGGYERGDVSVTGLDRTFNRYGDERDVEKHPWIMVPSDYTLGYTVTNVNVLPCEYLIRVETVNGRYTGTVQNQVPKTKE